MTVLFRVFEWNGGHQGETTTARKHGDEFKREAMRVARTGGSTRRQIANNLGIGFLALAK